jgi:hypothetical protein
MKDLHKRWSETIVARLRRGFAAREEVESIAYAVEKILKVPAAESRKVAEVYKLRRSELFRLCESGQPVEALRSLRGQRLPSSLSKLSAELSAHVAPAYTLSLPLTISSVLLLAHLTKDLTRRFCLLSTPLVRAYLRPLVEADKTGRVAFISSAEMLKYHREGRETSSMPVAYVTFPDHESTRSDTMWRIPFVGDTHQFSILEPLLFFRGAAPLYTLSVGREGEPNDLRLVKYELGATPQVITEIEIRAVLEWLALHLETVFRKSAPEVLSWELAYARSATAIAQVAAIKLKTVEGYLHTREEANASFDVDTYTWAVKELRKLQETVNNSVEPRRTAH